MSATIIDESYTYDREGGQATITYQVPYFEQELFASGLVGGLQLVGGVPQYTVPAVHPTRLGLYCSKVDVNPLGQLGEDLSSQVMVAVATFTRPESPDDDDNEQSDIAEESIDFGAQQIDLPKGEYEWAEGDKDGDKLGDYDIKPFKIHPVITYSRSYQNAVSLPYSTINSLIGKVNDGAFGVFASETALFMGGSSRRKKTTDGFDAWQIDYRFSINPDNWNKAWDGTQFSRLNKDLYEKTSFSFFA